MTPRGCTTPAILSNIAKGVFEKDQVTGDENFELIDGWEDLPEVYQETVRNALIEGHVADDDWKGVSSCNSIDSTQSPPTVHVCYDSIPLTANIRIPNATDLVSEASVSPGRRRPPPRRLFVIHNDLSFAKA